MSNGDFFAGYGAGQQQSANQAQGHMDVGYAAGKDDGYIKAVEEVRVTQGRFISRLMRHLMARNTQKKALMEELKKYSPEHPFLDETPITDNSMARAHSLSQRPDSLDYKRAVTGLMGERNGMTDSQEAVNMLVAEVDGLTTKGDMAMVEAGVAVVADGKDNNPSSVTDAVHNEMGNIFAKYNPDLEPSAYRTQELIPPPSPTQKALGTFVKFANMFSGR
jgi:hypothetical protein